MDFIVRRVLSPALALIAFTSCATGFGVRPEKETPLSPVDAARRMEATFAQLNIPVARGGSDGPLVSTRFDPMQVWGAAALERLQCGSGPVGDRSSGPVPYELQIEVRIRRRPGQSTRVSLDSSGRGRSEDGGEVRCALTTEFQATLLAGIPELGNGGPGWSRMGSGD